MGRFLQQIKTTMDFEKETPRSNQEQYPHLPEADEKHERLPSESGEDFLANEKEEGVRKGDEQKQLDTIRGEMGLKVNAHTEDIPSGEQLKSSMRNHDATKEVIRQHGLTAFEKWIEKIKKQDKIEGGAQKRVFIHPDDPQKIVAIFYTDRSVYSIKERFYVNKILNLLYPDNIPNIHLAASKPAVLVIDHVKGKEIKPWNLKHQFHKTVIERRLRKIGILIDSNYFNFMVNQDGSVFYIDDFIGNFNWNKEKLLKAVNRIDSAKRRSALNYLNRIEVLKNSPK